MNFFTYNDYIDYLENKNFYERLQKENRIKRKYEKGILEKVDEILLYLIKDKKYITEFLTECITAKFLRISERNIEVFQKINAKKNEEYKYQKNNRGTRNRKGKDRISMESNQLLEEKTIYKIKEKEIFFIIKYQTKINRQISYEILKECMEIMQQWKNNKKIIMQYPIIFPIIIYTGKEPWNKSHNQEKTKYITLKECGIYFTYNIIDVNYYTKEELSENKSLIFNLMLLKKVNKEQGKKYFELLINNSRYSKKFYDLLKIYDYIYRINPIDKIL